MGLLTNMFGFLILSCLLGVVSGYIASGTRSFAASRITTSVLLSDGSVKCMGSGGSCGQDSNSNWGDSPTKTGDNLPTVPLGINLNVTSLAAGMAATCVIIGEVNPGMKCWGRATFGSSGLGDAITRGISGNTMGDNLPFISMGSGRSVQDIAVGLYTSCAILENGDTKCWGKNEVGQSGMGDIVQRGDGPVADEMGDKLPAIPLGSGRTGAFVSCSFHGTHCIILDTGDVKCWGRNRFIGMGDDVNRGDGPNQMGDFLPVVPLGVGRSAQSLANGENHFCAILDNGSLKCWGTTASGEYGMGDNVLRGALGNQMGDQLPAVPFGVNRTVVAAAGGWYMTCVVLDNGDVKCCGKNDFGQLGVGDKLSRGLATGQMGDNLHVALINERVIDVTVGQQHVCVQLEDNTLKCWAGDAGAVTGHGDASWTRRGDNQNEMGDNLPRTNLGNGAKMGDLPGPPTSSPSDSPSTAPSDSPSDSPSTSPSDSPSSSPSSSPTDAAVAGDDEITELTFVISITVDVTGVNITCPDTLSDLDSVVEAATVDGAVATSCEVVDGEVDDEVSLNIGGSTEIAELTVTEIDALVSSISSFDDATGDAIVAATETAFDCSACVSSSMNIAYDDASEEFVQEYVGDNLDYSHADHSHGDNSRRVLAMLFLTQCVLFICRAL